jgi:L,D-transpeptidase catalytic domain
MRLITIFLIAFSLAAAVAGTARAEILIKVDKSAQRVTVVRNGEALYDWPVSTGRTGYATPSGSYTAFRMEADHYSKEWDDAPMPHSIFFTKVGHAIHGSYDTKKLGKPASHGCVRISPAYAATLFALVRQDGLANTKVVLTGSEQVALAQRGVRVPHLPPPLDLSAGYERENPPKYVDRGASYPQLDAQPLYADRNGEFRPQDYAQPSYVNPNYGFVQQPQYIPPRF